MLVGGGFLVFRFQSFPVVSSRFQWFLSSKCRQNVVTFSPQNLLLKPPKPAPAPGHKNDSEPTKHRPGAISPERQLPPNIIAHYTRTGQLTAHEKSGGSNGRTRSRTEESKITCEKEPTKHRATRNRCHFRTAAQTHRYLRPHQPGHRRGLDQPDPTFWDTLAEFPPLKT
nr:MAG TPA: hypothetical protein [Caudoviricetes sp.]